MLNPEETARILQEYQVQYRNEGGDSQEVRRQLKDVRHIQANANAFAAIREDGSVVTWGDPDVGGNCSSVQEQLQNVQQIQATGTAFAAILSDGSIVTWGNSEEGGDSSAVKDLLQPLRR